MLDFNNFPPQKAGDATLSAGARKTIEWTRGFNDRDVTSYGVAVGHCISGPRIYDELIDAQPQDTLAIAQPIVEDVAKMLGTESGINFARGVFRSMRPDFEDFRDVSDWDQGLLFQDLISTISQDATSAIAFREVQV